VRLMETDQLQAALDLLGKQADTLSLAVYARTPVRLPSPRVLLRRMPIQADAAAHQLFAVLRELDAKGLKLIWIEMPPASPEWAGVRDRLVRAAA